MEDMNEEILKEENFKERLYKHYESLRLEMTEADKLNYQIMVLLFTSSGAILSYSLNKENSYIGILLIYLIAFLGYRLLLGIRRRIWRIATYLETYIEPELENIFWERGLNFIAKSSSLIRNNELLVVNSVSILTFLLLILKYFFDNTNHITIVIIVISLIATLSMLLWSIYMFYKNNRNGQIHEGMRVEWKKAKDEYVKKTAYNKSIATSGADTAQHQQQ